MLKRLRASFKGQRRPSSDDSAIPSVAPVDSRAGRRNKSEGAVPYDEGRDGFAPLPSRTGHGSTSTAALQAAALRMSIQMRQRVVQRRSSVSNFLSSPLTAITNNKGGGHGLVWAEACMQGWRSHMEDAYIAQSDFAKMPGWSYFSILDGHAGKAVANVAAELLPTTVEAFVAPVRFSPRGLMDGVRRAFLRHDKDLERNFDVLRDQSGATCTSVLVGPSQIVLVNIGDSRIVMCRGGRPIVCTKDHKPGDEKELSRIQMAGGRVINQRVDGGLALSRAFGDFEYKMRSDLLQTQQKVTAEPDSIYIRRSPATDDFLVVACDGLWDVMSNEQACSIVYGFLKKDNTNPVEICRHLVRAALDRGSRDNISVLLVFFTKGHSPSQSAEEVTNGIGQSMARYSIRQGLGIVLSNPALWIENSPAAAAAAEPVTLVPGTVTVAGPEIRRQTQV